jgi:hypothetical protein
MWAKGFERNRNKNTDYIDAKFNGRYSIYIGVDEETTKMIKKWNRLYEGKEGEDDLRYFQFWRNHTHVTKDGDTYDSWGGAPVVVDDENFAWDSAINIGNGSVCTIKLGVNTVGKNTYVRLEGVRVEELVEFVGDEVEVEVDNQTDGLPF